MRAAEKTRAIEFAMQRWTRRADDEVLAFDSHEARLFRHASGGRLIVRITFPDGEGCNTGPYSDEQNARLLGRTILWNAVNGWRPGGEKLPVPRPRLMDFRPRDLCAVIANLPAIPDGAQAEDDPVVPSLPVKRRGGGEAARAR